VLKMNLFRIFLLLLPIAILGCNAEDQEAHKLGFESVEQMKQVHAKGWHTRKKYEEDNGIKNSETVEEPASLIRQVVNQKLSLEDLPCEFNGGAYEIFYKNRGLITTLAGKEQIPGSRTEFEFIDYGATRFVYKQKFFANDLVARQLNDANAVTASIEMDVIQESNVRLRTKKKITKLNFEKLMKGSKQYDTTTEDSFKLLCSSIKVKASPDDAKVTKKVSKEFPYKAILSCGLPDHINIVACFHGESGVGSELVVANGSNRQNMYKSYNLSDAGRETEDGLVIELRENFMIRAQNSHGRLILGLKVIDSENGKVFFQKQAAKFDVIQVKN
jgi:hypothetical protein